MHSAQIGRPVTLMTTFLIPDIGPRGPLSLARKLTGSVSDPALATGVWCQPNKNFSHFAGCTMQTQNPIVVDEVELSSGAVADRETAQREMTWEAAMQLLEQQLETRTGDSKPDFPELGIFFKLVAFQVRAMWIFTRNGILLWLLMVIVSSAGFLAIPMLWQRHSKVFCIGMIFSFVNFTCKALANRSIFGGSEGDGLRLFWILQAGGDGMMVRFVNSPQASQIKHYVTMFQLGAYGILYVPALIQFWWFHREDTPMIQQIGFGIFLTCASMPFFAGTISQTFVVQTRESTISPLWS
eukprot:SAG31_NODE_4857_length_2903_cov_2.721469_2_plen_297_part_00